MSFICLKTITHLFFLTYFQIVMYSTHRRILHRTAMATFSSSNPAAWRPTAFAINWKRMRRIYPATTRWCACVTWPLPQQQRLECLFPNRPSVYPVPLESRHCRRHRIRRQIHIPRPPQKPLSSQWNRWSHPPPARHRFHPAPDLVLLLHCQRQRCDPSEAWINWNWSIRRATLGHTDATLCALSVQKWTCVILLSTYLFKF